MLMWWLIRCLSVNVWVGEVNGSSGNWDKQPTVATCWFVISVLHFVHGHLFFFKPEVTIFRWAGGWSLTKTARTLHPLDGSSCQSHGVHARLSIYLDVELASYIYTHTSLHTSLIRTNSFTDIHCIRLGSGSCQGRLVSVSAGFGRLLHDPHSDPSPDA